MSDDEKPLKDKTEESDFDKDLKKGPVSPVNEDLFNFLDNLFTGEGEFPERIELRTVTGRNKDQYGQQLWQKIFKSGSSKPSRERVVMFTNEIIHRARMRTDATKKECVYVIGAMHHARHDDFYEVHMLTVKPRKNWVNGENGEGAEGGDDEDMPFSTRYNMQMLGHHNQWSSMVMGFMEGLVDRSDRQAAFAFSQLERLQARNIELLEVNMRLVQADDERHERMEKSKMWRENISKGLDMAWGILPPMLSSFKGNNAGWNAGMETSESYTLREFFKDKTDGGKLTKGEFEKIFGKLSEDGQQVLEAGVLSIPQGKLLAGIASKETSPDRLDDLLPNGPLEITKEQVMSIAESGIPIEVLAPLKMLLDVRMAKRAEQQQQKLG